MREPIEEAEAIARRIVLEGRWEATTRKHTCLLGWNTRQSLPEPLVDNGTCCLIQTSVRRFAVTCEHVWRGYEQFHRTDAEANLWISLAKGDHASEPSAALKLSKPRALAVDNSLDLAVFTFDEIDALESWRFWPLRYGIDSRVKKGDIVHFLGFPGEAVRIGAASQTLNYCFSSLTVCDVGHTKFLLHSASGTLHHKNRDGEKCPAFRIGGSSGAPVFKVCRNFELAFAGIVTDLSSSGLSQGLGQPYEMSDGDIYVAHACFIRENGLIEAP